MKEKKYPLATLVVLFYNHEQFVQDTIAGALSQTYPNLEIILSDDNSTDKTFEAIQRAVTDYVGPHKIILNKNEKNLGLVPHINKALFELSHGEYLFLNGGDDISIPERVSLQMEYFQSNPSVTAVTGSFITIDKNGKEIGGFVYDEDNLLKVDDKKYLSSDLFMTGGVGLSFRKNVLDVFGELNKDCQTEDSVLRFRSILLGPTLRSSKVILKYRVHDNNISRNITNFSTGKIAAQYADDLNVVKDSLSPELYQRLFLKIKHYTEVRELQEKESRRPKLFRPFYILRRKYLRFIYTQSIK